MLKGGANDDLSSEERWIISMHRKLAPEDKADAVKEIKKISEISEMKKMLNHLMSATNQGGDMRQAA